MKIRVITEVGGNELEFQVNKQPDGTWTVTDEFHSRVIDDEIPTLDEAMVLVALEIDLDVRRAL